MSITNEIFIVQDLVISRDFMSLDIIGLFHLRPYTVTLDTNYELILDMYKSLTKSINRDEIDFKYVINYFVLIVEKEDLNRILLRMKESRIHIKKRYKYTDGINSTLYYWKNRYIIDNYTTEPVEFVSDDLFDVLKELSSTNFLPNLGFEFSTLFHTKDNSFDIKLIKTDSVVSINLIKSVDETFALDYFGSSGKPIQLPCTYIQTYVNFNVEDFGMLITNMELEMEKKHEKKSFWKRNRMGKKRSK